MPFRYTMPHLPISNHLYIIRQPYKLTLSTIIILQNQFHQTQTNKSTLKESPYNYPLSWARLLEQFN